MTRRSYLQDRQRDQRRRRETQRLGALFADAVRARRATLTADAATPKAASPQPAADPTLPPASPTEDDR
jgi:hypothetical protein